MEENFWNIIEPPEDIDCPPSGRLVDVKFINGDKLTIEFLEIKDVETFKNKYKTEIPSFIKLEFPITVIRVYFIDTERKFELTHQTTMPGIVVSQVWAAPGTLGVAYDF